MESEGRVGGAGVRSVSAVTCPATLRDSFEIGSLIHPRREPSLSGTSVSPAVCGRSQQCQPRELQDNVQVTEGIWGLGVLGRDLKSICEPDFHDTQLLSEVPGGFFKLIIMD